MQVWKSDEKNEGRMILSDFQIGPKAEKRGAAGYPPPPTPLKTLDWRGFRKNALQNLERKGVRGHNLENKGVAGVSRTSSISPPP